MDERPRCEKCDTPLPGQAVGGLCANCLLKLAMDPLSAPTVVADELPPNFTEPVRLRYFGDYEVVEEIARGGMGVVYKARQVSLNRVVALKMILAGDFSSPAMVERFQTEAEAAGRLEHPNIVPIHEIGTHEGQHYFSMRFVEGGSLTKALARGKFSPRRATELMVKVARAVHHAHQRGILHRDLKPGNILLDAAGEPHVVDFGLAKLLEHDSALTQSAAVMGTPSYMAPEQAGGRAKQATTAVDVYSLGVIFYELLTGRPPFKGSSAFEVLVQVREREPASPRSINPELDRDLEVICLKCLEKEPARRYGSAEAMADDLQRWLNHEPIQARRTRLPERAWKWARRKPVVAGLVVALHLVGVAGLIGILWQGSRTREEARNARQEWSRAERELWNANFNEAQALRIRGGIGARVRSSALVQKLSRDPAVTEAQRLALRTEAIAQMALMDIALPDDWMIPKATKALTWSQNFDRYVRGTPPDRIEICEYPSHRVLASFQTQTSGEPRQAVLSPDGRFLAVRFKNSEVIVWRVETQERYFRSTANELVSISPDGRTLLSLMSGGVSLASLETNHHRFLEPRRAAKWAAFSPDSKEIAVLPVEPREVVEIWDAKSGEVRCSFTMDFNPHRAAWHPDGTRLVVGGDRGKLEMRTLKKERTGTDGAAAPFPLTGHTGFIDCILFPPDGATVVTNSWDSSSIAWDLVSGRPLLREERLIIRGLNSTGDRLFGSRDNPPAESAATLVQRTGYRTVASAGAARASLGTWLSPDGRLAAVNYGQSSETSSSECLLWDFARGAEIARFKGLWAQFSADSRTLFVFDLLDENLVRAFDVSEERLAADSMLADDGKILYEGGEKPEVNTGTLAGKTLVVAATNAVVFLDTTGTDEPRSWPVPAHTVTVSDDGKFLATSFHNSPTILRTAPTGRAVMTAGINNLMRFSPDNRLLAVVTPTEAQFYELPALQLAGPPLLHGLGHSVAPPLEFSPDGLTFAVGHDRTQVRLHETSSRRELATFTPPNPGQITGSKALEFSADGQWLLAAKNDGETVAWNLREVRAELAKAGLDWNAASPAGATGAPGRIRKDPILSLPCPARDPKAPPELIDLSRHYNAMLSGSWHPGRTGAVVSDLAEIPVGVQTLTGVSFDVRGLIQLGSRSQSKLAYPSRVTGMSVEQECQRLHFLHSAVYASGVGNGTILGTYLVRYIDGQTGEIPIVLGTDVADWFSQSNEDPGCMVIAWSGTNEESRVQSKTIRLFRTTWENPEPDIAIQSIDFVSGDARGVPFLVAITAE